MNTFDYVTKGIANCKRIRAAFDKTHELEGKFGVPERYCQKMFEQRLPESGMGSVYEDCNTIEDIARKLYYAFYFEAENENVMSGCIAFKANIDGGLYGMVPVADQPDDAEFVIEDYKNTGKVSLVLHTSEGRIPANETWIILGPAENGEEIVYTFHPGAPIPRATTSTDELPVGTKLTKQEALNLGFNLAKVC